MLFERADVGIGAGSEADVFRRNLEGIAHRDVDAVARLQIVHVHRFEDVVQRTHLHAVLQDRPATLTATILDEITQSIGEIVVILLRQPRHLLRPEDVASGLHAVLGDATPVIGHRLRLRQERTKHVGHTIAELEAGDEADVQMHARIRQIEMHGLLTVHRQQIHAGNLAESVAGKLIAVRRYAPECETSTVHA